MSAAIDYAGRKIGWSEVLRAGTEPLTWVVKCGCSVEFTASSARIQRVARRRRSLCCETCVLRAKGLGGAKSHHFSPRRLS